MNTTATSLEERVTALETEVAQLKQERVNTPVEIPWWGKIWGTFKEDLDYVEAMRLGREYRQSQPPAYEEDVTRKQPPDGHSGRADHVYFSDLSLLPRPP